MSTVRTQITRAATIRAMLLVLTGSIGMQVGAAIALTLFVSLGAAGTSGLRLLIAAVFMLVLFRPKLRGRTKREWSGILLYGVAMAAMNLLIYQAINRLPLGVATTLDFLGPCVVALLASRHVREGILAVVAFVGVALMAGFGGPFDTVGIMWGIAAGAAFAGYTLLAPRIGQSGRGLQSVALSITVAAILTLPLSVPLLPEVTLAQWGLLALSALAGTAIPFSVDTLAGRLTSARILGVFFAFDPVIGTLVGALFLGQHLTPIALVGVVLVVTAGASIVWLAGRRVSNPSSESEDRAMAATESMEIERKFEVSADAGLPSEQQFAEAGFSLGELATHQLFARYFDTPDGALAAQRIAFRMREGGPDAGWHVKQKGAEGTRELHWPLSTQMPDDLVAALTERIGDRVVQLRPIAELRTERRTLQLHSASGERVVEIADDRVRATEIRHDVAGEVVDEIARAWREWEAELVPGADVAVLDRVGELLIAAGAEVSPASAKGARAAGQLVAVAKAKGASAEEIEVLQQMDRNDREAARRLES